MVKLTDKALSDLLRRATGWPWILTWDEPHDRWSLLASAEAHRSHVAFEMGKDMDNNDRRICSLAPELAAEVLYWRLKNHG